jgi:undecaprenyl-diphosphatase
MNPDPLPKKTTHKRAGRPAQPEDADVSVGQQGKTQPGGRLAATARAVARRLRRIPLPASPPVWSKKMTAAAVIGLAAIVVAAFFDSAAIEFVRHDTSPTIRWMAYWTDVGKSQWYLVPAAVAFIGAGLWNWERSGFGGRSRLMLLFGQAGFALAAVAGSGILVNVVKFFVGRARPILFESVGPYHFEPFSVAYSFVSFPSGHSTTVGAVAAVLMLWFPRLRIPLLMLCAFFAATRIAARAHYPSDVAAGFVLGLLFAIALARFLAARRIVFRFDDDRMLPVVRRRMRGR